jgi:hypothetical protein
MAASSSFKPNPLSLSVPDPALDRWLRDSGYLDLLDSTTGGPSSASAPSASASAAASPVAGPVSSGVAADVLAFARTLASLLALNPFARLSTADLAAPTPSWSLAFVGAPGAASYSWPPTPTQARLRVQENVRRYARNYAALTILVFACCLYVSSIVLHFIPSLFFLFSKQLPWWMMICVNTGQVPDAHGAAGDAGQPCRLGGRALLPGPLGSHHQGSRDCPGSAALCTDW